MIKSRQCDFTKKVFSEQERKTQKYRIYHKETNTWFKKDIEPALYTKLLTLLSDPTLLLISLKEKEQLSKQVKQGERICKQHSKLEVKKLMNIYKQQGLKEGTARMYMYQVLNGLRDSPDSKKEVEKREKEEDRKKIVEKYLSLGYSKSSAKTYSYFVKHGTMPDPRIELNQVKKKKVEKLKEEKYVIETVLPRYSDEDRKELIKWYINSGLVYNTSRQYASEVINNRRQDPRKESTPIEEKVKRSNQKTVNTTNEHKQHLIQLEKDNLYMKKIHQKKKKVNQCTYCGKDTLNELCSDCEKNLSKRET